MKTNKLILLTAILLVSIFTASFIYAQDNTAIFSSFSSYEGSINTIDEIAVEPLDLLKIAVDYLYETLNPDTYVISSYWTDSLGNLCIQFKLSDDSDWPALPWLVVDAATGDAYFAYPDGSWLPTIAYDIRADIATHMNVGIDQVHINEIYVDKYFFTWGAPSIVRVGNFEFAANWRIDWYGTPVTKWVEVWDVVNTVTGESIYTYIVEILNCAFAFADWTFTEDQVLHFSVLLEDGSTIGVNMSSEGEIWMEDSLAETILKMRNETAQALGVDVSQVYLSGIAKDSLNVYILNIAHFYLVDEGMYRYQRQLIFSFAYNPVTGETSLKGITNETGIDYLAEAMRYISANFLQPDQFVFDNLVVENGIIILYFTSTRDHDSRGEVKIDLYTGIVRESTEATTLYYDGMPFGFITTTRVHDENGILREKVEITDNWWINAFYTLIHSEMTSIYNENGVITEESGTSIGYGYSGRIRVISTSHNTYHSDGLHYKTVHYEGMWFENPDGSISYKEIYDVEYREDGSPIKQSRTFESYDSSGHLISSTISREWWSYYSDGKLLRYIITINKYENNKLVDSVNESYYYNSAGEMISHYRSHAQYSYQNGVLKEYKIDTATYDKSGNLVSSSTGTATYENGIPTKWTVEYLKYENGKLVSSTTCTYYYDKNGRLSSYNRSTITYGDGGKVIERRDESKAYNQNGTVYFESVTVQKYDSNGNMVEMTGQSKRYDQFGKLTASSSYSTKSTYDANNVLRSREIKSLAYDGQWRLTYSYSGLYKYNENGRLYDVSGTQLTYKNGVLAEERSWHYIYDVLTYRLREATMQIIKYNDSGKMISDTTMISAYNANGVLISRSTTAKTYSPDGRILDDYTTSTTWVNASGIIKQEVTRGSRPIYGYYTINGITTYYLIGTETYYINSSYSDAGVLTYRNASIKELDTGGRVVEEYNKYTTLVDPSGVVREEKIMNGKKYGWVGIQWRIIETYTVTFQYDASGNLISESGVRYDAILGVKIEDYSRSLYRAWGEVTDVTQKNIYSNGVKVESITITLRYNQATGVPVARRIEGERYGPSGQLLETYSRVARSWDEFGNMTEEFAQGIKFDDSGHVIEQYNRINKYTAGTSGLDRMPSAYPGLPREILSSQVTEGKKFYADTGYMKEYYVRTATLIGCQGNVEIEETEGIIYGQDGISYGTYNLTTHYDIDGALSAQYGSVNVDGKTYTVEYEISLSTVTYTHVYDSDGNEVPDLGGSGLIEPFEIAKRYYGPSSQLEPKGAFSDLAPQGDVSVADRMDLENSAQGQTATPEGVTITGSLADNPLDTGYGRLQ